MPKRVTDSATKATSIDAGSGKSAEPVNLATAGVPDVLIRMLDALGLSDPLGIDAGSELSSLPATGSKPLHEFLGETFTPKSRGSGVPSRVRLTSIDPARDKVVTHALDKGFTQMDAGIGDMSHLIRDGELIPEGPAELSIPALVKKLNAVMKRAGQVSRR